MSKGILKFDQLSALPLSPHPLFLLSIHGQDNGGRLQGKFQLWKLICSKNKSDGLNRDKLNGKG